MISIIIPLFNRADLVRETLDSIQAQTFGDWECLVVDDGSTDASVAVVREYERKDPRFRLFIRPEARIKGAPTCRNIGYENSVGEYIYFFDSDDLLSPPFLEKVEKEMNNHPTAEYGIFQYSNFIESPDSISRETRKYNPKNGTLFAQIITNQIQANTPNFIWKRSLLDKSPLLWREGLPCSQDPDFACRIICHANEGTWLNIPNLVHVRRRGQSIGTDATKKPLHGYDIRTKIMRYIFDYCADNNKMTPHVRSSYFRQILRLQLVAVVLFGRVDIAKLYENLLKDIAQNTFQDKMLLFVAKGITVFAPLIYWTGTLCCCLHVPYLSKRVRLHRDN